MQSFPPLARRREIWVPTLWGWLLLAGVTLAAALLGVREVHSFLAITAPVGGHTLVVEGWMELEELDQVIATVRKTRYQRIVTTGGPRRAWPPVRELPSYADAAAAYLREHGLEVTAIPTPNTSHDHTYLSATTAREWAKRMGIEREPLDVYSVGAHTRRTRLLFQMAFGPGVSVGSYAARSWQYSDAWWRDDDSARELILQALGYAWVKCCYWPEKPA